MNDISHYGIWLCWNIIKVQQGRLGTRQTLTRVSISRNSRREITLGFPSRAGEVNFYVSFSSRFSRFRENISLSPLGSQDFCIELLFLLSIFKILENNFSFSSRFSRFCRTISLSPLDFQDLKNNFLLLISEICSTVSHQN